MSSTGYYDTSYPPSLWTNPDPHIGTVAPNTGVVNGGPYSITVTGTNFDSSSTVEVDGTAIPTVFVSATELTATYSPTTVGAKSVTVRNGSNMESNTVVFTVTATVGDEPGPTFAASPIDRDEMPPDTSEEPSE